MLLNVTKVNQLIRKTSQLFWERKDGQDIFLDGYWLIKADLSKPEYRKILALLVEKFGFIPSEGEQWKWGKWIEERVIESEFDYKKYTKIPKSKIIDTRLKDEQYSQSLNIFKGNQYIYVNSKYVEMIKDKFDVDFYGKRAIDPIYAVYEEDMLMILPVCIGSEGNSHLKKLEPTAGKQIGSEKI